MKRIIRHAFICGILAVVISSCYLKSVYPLVSPEDSTLVNGLEGVWEGDDAKWYFINDFNKFREYLDSDDNVYTEDDPAQNSQAYFVFFEFFNEGKRDTSIFIGSTIELNGDYYLDLFPYDVGEPTLMKNHLYPVHTFSKISISDNQLSIKLFEDDWIKDQIMNNRVRLKHENSGSGNVLITASTEELRKFVMKYGKEDKAYEDPFILKRIK